MHRHLTLALWTSLAALGAAILFACASSDDGPPATTWEQCGHVGCTPTDASPGNDTGTDSKPADVYNGPLTTLKGYLWWLSPPNFSPFGYSDSKLLQNEARVRAFDGVNDHTAVYVPDGGYSLEGLPLGTYPLMAEDLVGQDAGGGGADGGDADGDVDASVEDAEAGTNIDNRMFATYWPMVFKEGMDPNFTAVIRKADVEGILASVTPPLTLNPKKACVLVTIFAPGTSTGAPDITVTPPNTAEAVLYFVNGQWQANVATGTGGDGQALIVNMDAEPYPGTAKYMYYQKVGVGKGKTSSPIPIAQGAITIAYQTESYTEQ